MHKYWQILMGLKDPGGAVAVDLGYLLQKDPSGRYAVPMGNEPVDKKVNGRYKKLLKAGLGKRNFTLGPHYRLIAILIKSKREKLLKELPIVEGSTYFGTTHHWRGLGQGEKN